MDTLWGRAQARPHIYLLAHSLTTGVTLPAKDYTYAQSVENINGVCSALKDNLLKAYIVQHLLDNELNVDSAAKTMDLDLDSTNELLEYYDIDTAKAHNDVLCELCMMPVKMILTDTLGNCPVCSPYLSAFASFKKFITAYDKQQKMRSECQ